MAREILSKRNFFDFESPDSAINMFHCAFKSHGLECTSVSTAATLEQVTSPLLPLPLRIRISAAIIFDEQYACPTSIDATPSGGARRFSVCKQTVSYFTTCKIDFLKVRNSNYLEKRKE
jgi:hypothetical protein